MLLTLNAEVPVYHTMLSNMSDLMTWLNVELGIESLALAKVNRKDLVFNCMWLRVFHTGKTISCGYSRTDMRIPLYLPLTSHVSGHSSEYLAFSLISNEDQLRLSPSLVVRHKFIHVVDELCPDEPAVQLYELFTSFFLHCSHLFFKLQEDICIFDPPRHFVSYNCAMYGFYSEYLFQSYFRFRL